GVRLLVWRRGCLDSDERIGVGGDADEGGADHRRFQDRRRLLCRDVVMPGDGETSGDEPSHDCATAELEGLVRYQMMVRGRDHGFLEALPSPPAPLPSSRERGDFRDPEGLGWGSYACRLLTICVTWSEASLSASSGFFAPCSAFWISVPS